ncbi:hypothetical protein LY78DRAFT_630543 [Colletotrichum sublineola]|uniref:Uncharacterized protein n=1 Tax=Colletotrichum sublineola TaxID=1173701 RepID=A0A066XIV3_COLSU|nr:hypothetical protein LY78DRAFT_630543 [Colletotrichum sublineola]KDN68832.1 hypothetical protein CSUB01_05906 [Colletotrichum sublineola]
MGGFTSMPVEIIRLIFIEAVRVRGLKRAVRLRFVSKFWDREVTDAIVESGIINDRRCIENSFLWPKFFMQKLRQSDNLSSRPLRLIRRAAERVVAFRSGDPNFKSHEATQEYLWELCQLPPHSSKCGGWLPQWFDVPEKIDPVHESDDDFMATLLSAATITNDVALVRELLPSVQGRPTLIYQSYDDMMIRAFGHPLDVAAFLGHVEVLRLLLGTITDPIELEIARDDGIELASAGNQMGTLELCLVDGFKSIGPDPDSVLERTTSIPVFDAVYQACKDRLMRKRYNPWEPEPSNERAQQKLLSDRFKTSARLGSLALMKHLVQLGTSPRYVDEFSDNIYGTRVLVSEIAEYGYADVMAYLLENGAHIGERSLEAASKHGNPDCVRILLEHGARDTFHPGSAFLESINRENEPVVRLLLEWGTIVDDCLWRQAVDFAEKEGLTSMIKVLEEYRPGN